MASPGNLSLGELIGTSFGAVRGLIRPFWEIQPNPKSKNHIQSLVSHPILGISHQSLLSHPILPWLGWLALACLAIHRLVPASLALPAPCNNDTGRLRRPARRFAPRSLLLVQARRARPVRGEDSQASQGQASKPSQRWMVYETLGFQPRWPPAFFPRKNNNPNCFTMPAWSKFVSCWSKFDQK